MSAVAGCVYVWTPHSHFDGKGGLGVKPNLGYIINDNTVRGSSSPLSILKAQSDQEQIGF